jgi:hypothetical protein
MSDLEAKLAQYADAFKGNDTKARGDRERRIAMSPNDGRRRKRAPRARTKQLNLLITPELHRRMMDAKHERGVSMTELLEAAVEAYLKKGNRREGA